MNIFNINNVTKHAVRALESHMDILINSGENFEKTDDKFYKYFESGCQDYMKVSYNLVKKIISRTFNMEFVTVIKNVKFDNSFLLNLKYSGFPHTTDVYFQGEKNQKSKEQIEILFNDENLKKELLKSVSQVDLSYCKIEYNSISNDIKISICPYAGSYLWVVFPPVFYSLKLSEKEMIALYNMGIHIRNHIYMLLS